MRKSGSGLPDVITAIFILLTVGVIAYVLLLIADPESPLNPLARPTFSPILVIATDLPTNTPTITPTPLPPTPTPLASATPTITPTHIPTSTPLPSATPVLSVPTAAGKVSLSPTPSGAVSYIAKPITYQGNQTADGCKWSSIAGTVLDQAGNPVVGIAVHVLGGGGTIDETHYSGQERRFGPSGFEAFLGTQPREDDYTVQLLGQTGTPLSAPVPIHTKTGCQQNVAFVTFQQSNK